MTAVLQQDEDTWKILTKTEQDFHMTGFILMFLSPLTPIAIFKIICCVDADIPNICPYCESVLRQVEQEKMQQIADIDAMRSVDCDSTCSCTVSYSLNLSEFWILWCVCVRRNRNPFSLTKTLRTLIFPFESDSNKLQQRFIFFGYLRIFLYFLL